MGKNRKKPVRHRLEKRQKRSRQKKKSGLFDKVTMVVLVVAVCVFAFSLYQLVRTMVPYYSVEKSMISSKIKQSLYRSKQMIREMYRETHLK